MGSKPPVAAHVAPGGSLRFESDVSEVCGRLIGFRGAEMCTRPIA